MNEKERLYWRVEILEVLVLLLVLALLLFISGAIGG
jgi:hypothetical protein